MTVAPAENRSQPICSGNCLKAGRALCAQVETGCTKQSILMKSRGFLSANQTELWDVSGVDCRSPPQHDTNSHCPDFTTLGEWTGWYTFLRPLFAIWWFQGKMLAAHSRDWGWDFGVMKIQDAARVACWGL